jgi:hypothetical protein
LTCSGVSPARAAGNHRHGIHGNVSRGPLNEVWQFLSGLQQILAALSKDDMETVARVAHSLGSPMTHHMPADLKQALPEEFRKLGFSVHAGFDQIALDAESPGDGKHTLSQLGETLSRCVSCHNAYQIHTVAGP